MPENRVFVRKRASLFIFIFFLKLVDDESTYVVRRLSTGLT